MGRRLINLQEADFTKCIDYYQSVTIDRDTFRGDSKSLMETAHKIAFTMTIVGQKISDVPEWAVPYFNQLRSDAVQLLPSTAWGTRRTLHLYERASIEDLFRYIYFFDHKIEHLLLQTYPKRFPSFDTMVDWTETYPGLVPNRKAVSQHCSELTSRYAELSRTVHGTTMSDQQLLENLRDASKPMAEPVREMRTMRSVFGNIFFLLSLFHLKEFRQFRLDERILICQHLSKKQIQVLSGLHVSQ